WPRHPGPLPRWGRGRRCFINADDVGDFEWMFGQRGQQRAAQIIEIEILPAGAVGGPDEAFAVFEKAERRKVLGPARGPFFADDDTAFAGSRISSAKYHDVLGAIGAMK